MKAEIYLKFYFMFRRVTKNGTRAWTPEDGSVTIHPSSVNDRVREYPNPFITYFTKQLSTAIYLHDTTCVSASILLFTAPKVSISTCILLQNNFYIIFNRICNTIYIVYI